WCNGILLPDVVLAFDDDEFAGATVKDILADPARFEGATLADPLEGVEYGRCKAKIMLRADGTPWIHSFAHGRSVYELKLDARTVQAGIEQTSDEAVVGTFVSLALAAELDDVEFQKLLKYTAERAGIGVRAINSKFKAAELQQDQQRDREEQTR